MIIAFGGTTACQNGLEVAQLTASDPAMMKKVYEQMIGAFYKVGITNFDFDIEGPGVQSSAALAISKTRFDVLKQIQQDPRFSKMQTSFCAGDRTHDRLGPEFLGRNVHQGGRGERDQRRVLEHDGFRRLIGQDAPSSFSAREWSAPLPCTVPLNSRRPRLC